MSEVRLIDANALWEFMRTYDDYQGAKEAHDLELIHRDSILFAIENAQPVDAVQVVRCKECKWWWKVNGLCTHPKHCHDNVCVHECGKDYFCADGERRTE